MAAVRSARLVVLAVFFVGCGSASQRLSPERATASVATSKASRTPCDVAAELRGRAASRVGEGRLDRALRALRRADELCPASAPASQVQLAQVLSDLGDFDEVRQVLGALTLRKDLSPSDSRTVAGLRSALAREASRERVAGPKAQELEVKYAEAVRLEATGDHVGAKRQLLEVWEASRPRGEVLNAAARATMDAADGRATPESRRMFDRALHELEAQHSPERAALQAPDGIHGESAEAVTLSPDGETLAIAHGRLVTLYATASLRPRRTLSGHSADVQSVAISPDGKLIASRDADQEVRVWDRATGALSFATKDRTAAGKDLPLSSLSAVAFSPDGKSVLSTGGATTVNVWDAATGKRLRTLEADTGEDPIVAVSTDGKTLASGGRSGAAWLRIWDGTSGRLVFSDGDKRPPYRLQLGGLAFSSDGKYLAAKVGIPTDIWLWTPAGVPVSSKPPLGPLGLEAFRDGGSGSQPEQRILLRRQRDRVIRA